MARAPIVFVLIVVFAPIVGAEEESAAPEAAAPEIDAAVSAWRWRETVDEWRMAVLKQGRILREGAETDAQKERAQRATLDALRLGSTLKDEAETAFREAFERTTIEAWDIEAHDQLVRAGLDLAARRAFDEDPNRAIEIWEQLAALFPDSREALYVRTTWLPLALPSTGDLDLAIERLTALVDEVEEEWKPQLIVAVGDVDALRGDYEAARRRYQEALDGIPEDADRNDPRGRLRGHLELRLALIGMPAPEIADAEWFGAKARPLSTLRGRVVLLDFQATWCAPCLKSLPHLEALECELGPRGLTVLALTREYAKKGVLPERPGKPRVLYRGTTREAYRAHLEAFRERVGMTIPLLLIEKEVSEAYPVRGLPTMLVLDRDGTVGYIAIGGRRRHVLRLAIERRLAP